ncbi:hypothetical protein [Actinomadura macrotermitis]|uniref:hypothetical protein n=1 Tax=Actinomadura macrotermitis TaxID=2585200 RepID=UPI0018869810|nr:hypothetical protein [Actinomadura macrotermitis]
MSSSSAPIVQRGRTRCRKRPVSQEDAKARPPRRRPGRRTSPSRSRDLYRYLTERVAALEAVGHVETAPIVRNVKRVGTLLDPAFR